MTNIKTMTGEVHLSAEQVDKLLIQTLEDCIHIVEAYPFDHTDDITDEIREGIMMIQKTRAQVNKIKALTKG